MPSITYRTFIISTYSLYIAADTYCSVVGYLNDGSGFLAWLLPDLLAIALLAANVLQKRSYTSYINKELARWTFLICWFKPLWNAAILLHAMVGGYSPEFGLNPTPYGGSLSICVHRYTYGVPYEFQGEQKISEMHTMFCDTVINVRWAVHGLNLVHAAVQLRFLMDRVWNSSE
ncbi:hypothetical protein BG005_002237 [Podila minutissima]|nr:hypothetical protein BG005_002237 [Podila minutissima]